MDRLPLSLRLLLLVITVILYSCLASSAVVSRRDARLSVESEAGKRNFPGVHVLCQISRRNCPGGFRKRFSSLEENGSSSLSDVDPSSLSGVLLSGQPWEEREMKERQRFRERLDVLEALQDIVLPPDAFDSRQ